MTSYYYAYAELERRLRTIAEEPVAELYPKLNPGWSQPDHLRTLAEAFERAETEGMKIAVSLPPRHGKTEFISHALVRWLCRIRDDRLIYASYSANVAKAKSRRILDYVRAVGLRVRKDSRSVSDWQLSTGGGLLATGVGGEMTGHGARVLVIDDPHKSREDAESVTRRQRVWDWYTSTCKTRLDPNGSIIVVHTRWHADDLIGRLSQTGDWTIINLPAIDEDGRALWPDRWPLRHLEAIREEIGEYDWSSLYQGRPIPAGGKLMHEPVYYTAAPADIRYSIGVDLAYSKTTKRDSSVAVVVGLSQGRYYVEDVVSGKLTPKEFAQVVNHLRQQYKVVSAPRFDGTATERAAVDLFDEFGMQLDLVLATRDKFLRSQRLAALWNAGLVMVKRGQPWTQPYVKIVTEFTGCGDLRDDEVDATVSALNVFGKPVSAEYASSEILDRLR